MFEVCAAALLGMTTTHDGSIRCETVPALTGAFGSSGAPLERLARAVNAAVDSDAASPSQDVSVDLPVILEQLDFVAR